MVAEPGVLLEAMSVFRHNPLVASVCKIFATLDISAANGRGRVSACASIIVKADRSSVV